MTGLFTGALRSRRTLSAAARPFSSGPTVGAFLPATVSCRAVAAPVGMGAGFAVSAPLRSAGVASAFIGQGVGRLLRRLGCRRLDLPPHPALRPANPGDLTGLCAAPPAALSRRVAAAPVGAGAGFAVPAPAPFAGVAPVFTREGMAGSLAGLAVGGSISRLVPPFVPRTPQT